MGCHSDVVDLQVDPRVDLTQRRVDVVDKEEQ
jgi:hypothetical protein